MKPIFLILLIISISACKEQKPAEDLSASVIIDNAIEKAGGKILDTATVSFRFRDRFYRARRDNGLYELERCTDAACKDTLDQLTNSDFKRFINEKQVKLADSLVAGLSGSVNSVHYFSVLPYGLDAEAVQAKKIGVDTINGKTYYEVHVSFAEDGGGEDFEDEYMYWFNTENFEVDYLAYNYHVNEGGTRFRQAINPRIVNGVRFVDYINYEPETTFPPLEDLDSLFQAGKLKELSRIILEDVQVN